MKKFFRFFISRQFLLNILAIVIVWIVLIWVVFYSIKAHTGYGESVEVPSFYKIHIDDLDEFVRDKNLNYEIQDSVYLDDWPKGTVCWQYPRPTDSTGMSVKNGRTIFLSVVPLHPKMITMPKVVDMSKRMAETSLSALGLKTKITYKPAVEGTDFVLQQLYKGNPIKPGTTLPKGSRIELIVAQGQTGEITSLPNLIGMTISEANERLQSLTVATHLAECTGCVTEADYENAVIVNQNPSGGESVNVAAGTTVTIWASKRSASPD